MAQLLSSHPSHPSLLLSILGHRISFSFSLIGFSDPVTMIYLGSVGIPSIGISKFTRSYSITQRSKKLYLEDISIIVINILPNKLLPISSSIVDSGF